MSDGIKFSITLKGADTLVAKMRKAPDSLKAQLRAMLTPLASDMRSQAAGDAPTKTGALAGAIEAKIIETKTAVAVNLGVSRIPYASAQEDGASIPAHIIQAANGKALAFQWTGSGNKAGMLAAFSLVHHPGGEIQGKHYIRNTLLSRKEEFRGIVTRAMLESV